MDEQYFFRVSDGQVVKSLFQLISALEQMSDDTFRHHVNEHKNDFYNWIKDIYQMYDLCARMEGIADREGLIGFLKKNVRELVLVLNAGSSSLKFCLYDQGTRLIDGMIDAIGKSRLCKSIIKRDGQVVEKKCSLHNHRDAVEEVLHALLDHGVIKDYSELLTIGHRVVHGGELYTKPTRITNQVKHAIMELGALAPLHNPPALKSIETCEVFVPTAEQFAIFDTAFHQTIPDQAFLYGLPYELYEQYKIRKYGFHGINHQYLSRRADEILDKKLGEIITCHLGNGSSITAVKDGKSVDTSMGFTPLDGLIMGTRSGDIDPEIILFLLKTGKYSVQHLDAILNKESGLQGITHLSSDVRELYEAANTGNKMARLALDMLAYRVGFFIGGYMTVLHGLECIVFSGGIGENAWYIREKVLKSLEYAGVDIDREKNKRNELVISTPYSQVSVLVIPANEEEEMLREIQGVMHHYS